MSNFELERGGLGEQNADINVPAGSKDLVSNCPNCGNPSLPITYGLPTVHDLQDSNFYSGGCIVRDDSPEWACRACEVEF